MSRSNAKEGTRRHKGRASVLSRARALGIDGYLSPQDSSAHNTLPEGSNGQAAGAVFLVPERLDTPMALNTRSRSTDSEMYRAISISHPLSSHAPHKLLIRTHFSRAGPAYTATKRTPHRSRGDGVGHVRSPRP